MGGSKGRPNRGMAKLGVQVKLMRAMRGVTQEQAAREIGCTISALQKWEQGVQHPRWRCAVAVEKWLAGPQVNLTLSVEEVGQGL